MTLCDLSIAELAKIKAKFPKLDRVRTAVWEGVLDIYAQYEENTISDSFKIRIDASPPPPARIPTMSEIGGRTQAIACKYDITDLRRLHYNRGDGTACLCPKQEETRRFSPGPSLITFVDDLVIPYLYGLSFFEKNGRWPWREYSHGGLGLLEFHAEDTKVLTREEVEEIVGVFRADPRLSKKCRKQLRDPRGNNPCICGSGSPFQGCHSLAWRGLLKLNSDLRRLRLNAFKLLTPR